MAIRQIAYQEQTPDALAELRRLDEIMDTPTQQTDAIRLPKKPTLVPAPKITQPIPLAELQPLPKTKITKQVLPIDDLGRPYATITNAKEMDTRALARRITDRYLKFEGKLPFSLVFCKATRYLHICKKPYEVINGQCIYFVYEPGEGDFDVMARG